MFIRFFKMNIIIVFITAIVGMCGAIEQFYVSPQFAYRHPAALRTSVIEDTLPYELRNNFYKNPAIANKLAQSSWLLNKEMQVIDRDTDKIPRQKVYDVLHHAGFVRR